MKYLTSIAASLLVALSSTARADNGMDLFLQVRPSVVQLVGTGAGGRYYLGSGVALQNGTVITNCHVTQRAQRIQLFSGARAFAQSQAADVAHDLCALSLPGAASVPSTLGSSRELKVGDPVIAVGFNSGRGVSYEVGEVAELFEHDNGMVIRTTAQFTHGASGGGLFDRAGRLVGILTFYRVSHRRDYFAVPVEWISRLDAVPTRAVQPLEGIPFWADRIERQPAFLQAGALEADSRWDELASFARRWTQSNVDDGQAWLMLGKAAAHLGDHAAAEEAFLRAAELGFARPAEIAQPLDH